LTDPPFELTLSVFIIIEPPYLCELALKLRCKARLRPRLSSPPDPLCPHLVNHLPSFYRYEYLYAFALREMMVVSSLLISHEKEVGDDLLLPDPPHFLCHLVKRFFFHANWDLSTIPNWAFLPPPLSLCTLPHAWLSNFPFCFMFLVPCISRFSWFLRILYSDPSAESLGDPGFPSCGPSHVLPDVGLFFFRGHGPRLRKSGEDCAVFFSLIEAVLVTPPVSGIPFCWSYLFFTDVVSI